MLSDQAMRSWFSAANSLIGDGTVAISAGSLATPDIQSRQHPTNAFLQIMLGTTCMNQDACNNRSLQTLQALAET